MVDDTCTEQVFQASTWLLGRAIQMHWSPISHPGWMGVPNLFSNGRAQRTDSFKTMIHFLTVCRNLTSLALTGIIVSGEHQHAIYSLPHLRKITLRSARFQNTAVKIPKHNVTHLRLFNVLSEVGLSHILHQTSSTLTTLQINEGPAKAFSLRTPRCPRLTTFTHSSPRSENKQVWSFLERNPTIRIIRLNARYCLPDQGPILLPTLSKMTASWEFGRFFLARPELIEFHQHPSYNSGSVRGLWSCLKHAQRAQLHPSRLEQLRVAFFHYSDDFGALPVISHVFGSSLCRLHIWVEGHSIGWPPYPRYTYLLGGWTRLNGPGPYPGNQVNVEFARLRFIQVSFGVQKGVKFPKRTCKKLLMSSILPLCPALEEALFTAISSYDAIEREEPGDGMQLRIRKNGRKWDLAPQN